MSETPEPANPALALSAELDAMKSVAQTLQSLDADATRRVLKWCLDRYQVTAPASAAPPRSGPPAQSSAQSHAAHHDGDSPPAPREPQAFADFADLFDAANPDTAVEFALIAAYWFQAVQKHTELDSQQLNGALKNLGRPSSNITRDLDSLMTRTPRLVIQVRKDGTTKQARKRYKLTTEGVRAVERMLARGGKAVEPANVEE